MYPIWQVMLGLFGLVAICMGGVLSAACNDHPGVASSGPQAAVSTSPVSTLAPTPTVAGTPSVAAQATPTRTPTLPPRPLTGRTETFAIVPEESMLTYTITQVLLDEGGRTEQVVGRTRQLAGQFALNYDDPRNSGFGMITANLNTLTSDNPERDEALRSNWLEFARFPLAYFLVREVRNFPPDFQPAKPLDFQLVGDLTLKGVTRPTTWDTTAALYLDRLKGTATTRINLADFGIPLPLVPGLIEVTDGVTVTLEYTFKMIQPPPLPGGT
ncbi:MAG: hypothetical protein DDG58_04845 [Ardenticatenia bacterium]|jgi:polyisoprenoid-binding protein YceI|nr:MAG: hypothetical protein DDG58_04845 [Ardenticatenia bacterium]